MTVTAQTLPRSGVLRQLAAVGAASLVFASCGVLLVWPAAALPSLTPSPLSASEGAWVVAALHAGQVLGAAPGGALAARVGRRRALLWCAPLLLASWLATAWARALAPLVCARALGGVAVGVAFAAGPLYVAEAASARLRGAVGALPQLALSLGQLLAYCGGAWLSLRALALLAAALPLLFAAALCCAPETPHWLLSRGRRAEALAALRRLRGPLPDAELQAELSELEAFAYAEADDSAPLGGFKDLFTDPAARRALWIVMTLVALQCFSGFTALLAYCTTIFNLSGSSMDANHSGIVVGVILVVMCVVTSWVLDRAGRRFCLLVSCVGTSVALALEGAFFLGVELESAAVDGVGWLSVAALVAFFVAFTLGLGPLPCTLAGELFPARVRGAASTLVSVGIGAGGFAAAKIYQVVSDTWGVHVTMWLFGSVCLLGVWFALAGMPETRGCSFEEIQEMLLEAAKEKKQPTGPRTTPPAKAATPTAPRMQLEAFERRGSGFPRNSTQLSSLRSVSESVSFTRESSFCSHPRSSCESEKKTYSS